MGYKPWECRYFSIRVVTEVRAGQASGPLISAKWWARSWGNIRQPTLQMLGGVTSLLSREGENAERNIELGGIQ